MKAYEITLTHDAGEVTIRTHAGTIFAAIENVCNAEKAPRSAVKTWRVVPTAKQIARTKNLLRSL